MCREEKIISVIARLRNSCSIAIAIFKKYKSSHRRCRSSYQRYSATQMLSCEVCKTFKNTYFEEHLQMTASGGALSCS